MLRRGLFRCSDRATSSLPVPLSPMISTVLLVSATSLIFSNSSRIAGHWPTMLSMPCRSRSCRCRSAISTAIDRFSSARSMRCLSSLRLIGLERKSKAPCLSASTAASTLPTPETMMTAACGACFRASRSNSMPSVRGIFRSVTMTATPSWMCSIASSPSLTAIGSHPCRSTHSASVSRLAWSSSTSKMRGGLALTSRPTPIRSHSGCTPFCVSLHRRFREAAILAASARHFDWRQLACRMLRSTLGASKGRGKNDQEVNSPRSRRGRRVAAGCERATNPLHFSANSATPR